jgi:hypothetical protein
VATGGDGEHRDAARIGDTPLNWISEAYQCEYPTQLKHAGEMFRASGTASRFLDDFYIMDVILNRCPYPDEIKVNDGARRPPCCAVGKQRILSGWSAPTNLRTRMT